MKHYRPPSGTTKYIGQIILKTINNFPKKHQNLWRLGFRSHQTPMEAPPGPMGRGIGLRASALGA